MINYYQLYQRMTVMREWLCVTVSVTFTVTHSVIIQFILLRSFSIASSTHCFPPTAKISIFFSRLFLSLLSFESLQSNYVVQVTLYDSFLLTLFPYLHYAEGIILTNYRSIHAKVLYEKGILTLMLEFLFCWGLKLYQ